jgi:predicted DNA-binding protein YlxM (UPF0122 family)
MKYIKKLTDQQREEAVQTYLSSEYSMKEVGEIYGVTKQNIAALLNAKKRKDKALEEIAKMNLKTNLRNK